MSEEEIIKTIKEKIILDFNCYNPIDKIELKAIQGLLDLYNKEKEKNKELEKQNKRITDEYMIQKHLINKPFLDKNYIPKSKVMAEIKELQNRKDYKPLDNRYTYKEVIEFGIEELEQILQEGDTNETKM